MEVRLSGCLVLPSNDSREGPISYASEFLVIFLPWYNCCVYVLNGNKMLLNWIWIENQVTRQLHLHDPNCITLALIHHCVGAMGSCCCVLPWWKCRGPESSQRWGLAVTMGTVSVCMWWTVGNLVNRRCKFWAKTVRLWWWCWRWNIQALRSIPCMLMHWLLKSPVHQQAWYWLCRTDYMFCCSWDNHNSYTWVKPNTRYDSECGFIFYNFKTIQHVLEVIFSCDQAALQMVFSVCPSVHLSVCPSVRHTFLTMFPSSYHHETFRSYYQWPT